MRHDAGMTNYLFLTHQGKRLEPRVFAWWATVLVQCVLWCAVRAQMCRASGCSVYTPHRLSGSFSPGQPKLVLILRKTCSPKVRPWRMPGIPTSCRPLVAFPICGRGRWRRRRQVSLRQLIEPPARSRIDRTVVFFNSFERLFFSLSYLVASRNGSVFLLGACLFFSSCNLLHSLFAWATSGVVDSTAAEHHPDSISESNVLSFEFPQFLLRRVNDFQGNSVK